MSIVTVYQTFRPNLGPSSVVDQGTWHGDYYTQIGGGRGQREKTVGRNTGGCVVCVQNMQGLGLNNWDG